MERRSWESGEQTPCGEARALLVPGSRLSAEPALFGIEQHLFEAGSQRTGPAGDPGPESRAEVGSRRSDEGCNKIGGCVVVDSKRQPRRARRFSSHWCGTGRVFGAPSMS